MCCWCLGLVGLSEKCACVKYRGKYFIYLLNLFTVFSVLMSLESILELVCDHKNFTPCNMNYQKIYMYLNGDRSLNVSVISLLANSCSGLIFNFLVHAPC